MKDDGYTLAEALAALLMVGLTIGGLVQGLHVIGKLQTAAGSAVRDDRTLRAAGQGFARLLEGGGPFVSDGKGLSGDASEVDFTCGAGVDCTARLVADGPDTTLALDQGGKAAMAYRFKGVESARFVYGAATSASAIWPPKDAANTPRQTLRSISVTEATPNGEAALVHVRLWAEQPTACQFDMISQACREAGQ